MRTSGPLFLWADFHRTTLFERIFMPVAALSPEGKLETGLRELGCSGRNFVEIAKALGARIAHGPFSEALNGKKGFDREIGAKLLEVLDRMRELQSAIYTAVDSNGNRIGFVTADWSRTEKVSDALTYRLLAHVAREMDISGVQQVADRATQQVVPKVESK